MGKSRALAIALLALAACGSDKAQPDAQIVVQDAPPPDMKIFEDAPPPMYDLSCLNDPAPTQANDPITLAGNTTTFTQNGPQPLADVAVDVFTVGDPTPVATVTSDSTGAFTTGDIATGGTPVNGYVRGMKATYRSSYLYPGTVIPTSLTNVPVTLVSQGLFDVVSGQVAQVTQDDSANGALLVLVTDCTGTAINGATLSVKQDGTDVGEIFDLGALVSQAAGTFFVFNVPDGETEVTVSYDSMAFPPRTVTAYKKPDVQDAEGTITLVQVTPSN